MIRSGRSRLAESLARLGPRVAALIWAFAAVAGACSGSSPAPAPQPASREALVPVVDRDAVVFAPGTVPAALVEHLAGGRLVLLGETHYVQEHQELLVALLAQLQGAGFRRVLQEEMHAAAWTGDEYAMLRSDVLPVHVAAFNRTLLEGLRALNAGLPEAERVHFVGFDLNHSTGLLPEYLRIFQDRIGTVPQLDPLLAATPDSAQYAAALEALPAALEVDAPAISAAIGADRYAQLLDLVEVERKSLRHRRSRDLVARELFIRERILKALAEAGVSPVAVNCGAFHAQKSPADPTMWEPVGAWLAAHAEAYGGDPASLRSVFFLPARGEILDDCCSGSPRPIDVVRDAPSHDLVRILAERAGTSDAWLPFEDPIFSRPVEVDGGGMLVVIPNISAVFDGLISYSDVSVLESLALLP